MSAAEANDGQRVGLSDDEGSIVSQPSKTPSCGACRTRESNVWWKAPKGLPTSVLCETCGTNWRKYADLNVRPVREESLPTSKSRGGIEKREGTPLAGPSAKKARVSRCHSEMRRHQYFPTFLDRQRPLHSQHPHHQRQRRR